MIVFVMCLIFYCTQSHNHHPHPVIEGHTHTRALFTSSSLQVWGNGGAHHDPSVLPANRRKVNAVVLQQHTIGRLRVTSGGGIPMAALHNFAVQIMHHHLRVPTPRTKQSAHLVVDANHVGIVAILVRWRHRGGGGPDQGSIRLEHALQLKVERLHVLFVLLCCDRDVHFWANVVQAPIEVNHVPTLVRMVRPNLGAVNHSVTRPAIIFPITWSALNKRIAEWPPAPGGRRRGAQHLLHIGQVTRPNAADAVANQENIWHTLIERRRYCRAGQRAVARGVAARFAVGTGKVARLAAGARARTQTCAALLAARNAGVTALATEPRAVDRNRYDGTGHCKHLQEEQHCSVVRGMRGGVECGTWIVDWIGLDTRP